MIEHTAAFATLGVDVGKVRQEFIIILERLGLVGPVSNEHELLVLGTAVNLVLKHDPKFEHLARTGNRSSSLSISTMADLGLLDAEGYGSPAAMVSYINSRIPSMRTEEGMKLNDVLQKDIRLLSKEDAGTLISSDRSCAALLLAVAATRAIATTNESSLKTNKAMVSYPSPAGAETTEAPHRNIARFLQNFACAMKRFHL